MVLRAEKLLRGQSEMLQIWRLHADKSTAQAPTCEGFSGCLSGGSRERRLSLGARRYDLD